MSIYDVPKRAGISIATVSRVLNNSANVSEKTREKVLKVMDDLGYTPNVFTRGLGLNTMQTIGVMCSDSSDPYLAGAIYYLERGLRLRNYDTILCCTGYDLGTKQKYFELLCSKRVDVIILAGPKFVGTRSKDNAYTTEAAADLPVMLVNGYLEGDNIYSTVCDDRVAAFGTATQLLQAGRRRVLYLYTDYSYGDVNRLERYRNALKAFGMEPKDELIHQCPKDIGASKELPLPLREQGLSFGAITTSNDSLMVDTVKYAHEAGIPISEELNITGYNNSILSRCMDPEIISIDSKVEALCTTTINTLMGVFSSVNVPSQTTIVSDLIKRRTASS